MNVTYIHHSCFLVETDRFYYLFDYEKGALPEMDTAKPIYVLSSHKHGDHYNREIFPMLNGLGMQSVRPVLSKDIKAPEGLDFLKVYAGKQYEPEKGLTLTTFRSTDAGVAFLLEEGDGEEGKKIIYHAGDLNDWTWAGESDAYNTKMTADYRKQISLLAEMLGGREIDVAFVVLDPRQEKDYDRGMTYFLENIPVKAVYPMHYWEQPAVIGEFLKEHPEYEAKIQRTE